MNPDEYEGAAVEGKGSGLSTGLPRSRSARALIREATNACRRIRANDQVSASGLIFGSGTGVDLYEVRFYSGKPAFRMPSTSGSASPAF